MKQEPWQQQVFKALNDALITGSLLDSNEAIAESLHEQDMFLEHSVDELVLYIQNWWNAL